MQKFILLFVLALSFSAFSQDTFEVKGKILFKDKEDMISKKEATLTLPVRGKGEISLTTDKGTWSTKRFFVRKIAGRKVFYIVFKGEKKVYVMRGTYLRGKNKAVYYGDVYHKHFKEKGLVDEFFGRIWGRRGLVHGLKHKGGFAFSADIDPTMTTLSVDQL